MNKQQILTIILMTTIILPSGCISLSKKNSENRSFTYVSLPNEDWEIVNSIDILNLQSINYKNQSIFLLNSFFIDNKVALNFKMYNFSSMQYNYYLLKSDDDNFTNWKFVNINSVTDIINISRRINPGNINYSLPNYLEEIIESGWGVWEILNGTDIFLLFTYNISKSDRAYWSDFILYSSDGNNWGEPVKINGTLSIFGPIFNNIITYFTIQNGNIKLIFLKNRE